MEDRERRTWLQREATALARRGAMRVLSGLWSQGAAHIAVDWFLQTRLRELPQSRGVPMGARRVQGEIDAVYRWGPDDAPTIVLVHGWGAESTAMMGLVKPLRAIGFGVVAFDAPAHGACAGTQTTLMAFSERVAAVLRAVGAVGAVAHSLGGIATVAALARTGEAGAGARSALQALALLSSPCDLSAILRSFSTFWRIDPAVSRRMGLELHRRDGVPIDYWDIRSLATSAMIRDCMVVHDRDDDVVPVQEAQRCARALGCSEITLTSGLGHGKLLAAGGVPACVAQFIKLAVT